ncbi:class I SAM-dependent rRNA methyltransferase [Singulisphaera sp. PoT]|uniref:class I SAM-dependent rRNA methyltransferase n=1 Tax=Singulisphaera sp. PoT TaxID=3411797 RepID=UPI003BF5EC8F
MPRPDHPRPNQPPRRGGYDQGGPPYRQNEPSNFLAGVPDRPLDVDGDLPIVSIRAAGHHPFVYRKMVVSTVGHLRPSDGDLVRVVDRDRLPVGFGLWNSRSQINIRLLAQGVDAPGADFWVHRAERAISLRREALGLDEVTNAYRVVHAEGDGLSGLIMDRFDDVLSVEIFSLGMYQRIGPILEIFSERLGTKHFRVQVDERIALAEDFPGRPVISPKLPPRVTIHENGVRYRVNFEGSHKTGFFCDQRENRLALTRFTPGRTVLDLCCYSGGFGVAALARGKASEVTCVDLDEKAIGWARDNGNLNQVRPTFVHADAFSYMRQMVVNGRSYGVVVLDPPKLIPGRLDISAGKRKYFDLNVLAMSLVEPGGLLLTCSCSGLLSAEEFLILLRAAARKARRSVQVLNVTGASPDHPIGLEALEGSYLKAIWLRIGEPTGLTTIETLENNEGEDEGEPEDFD